MPLIVMGIHYLVEYDFVELLAMTLTKVYSCFGLRSQWRGSKIDFSNPVSRRYFSFHSAIPL